MVLNRDFLQNVPDLQMPAAAFKPYVVHGGIVHVSGQLPVRDGKPVWVGRVPGAVSVDQAREAAELCALNVLAWLKHACQGDFARVERCVRLGGFVAADEGFADAPAIINAASQVMTTAFGDRGEHARIAIGIMSLPFDAPVEVEAVFAIR